MGKVISIIWPIRQLDDRVRPIIKTNNSITMYLSKPKEIFSLCKIEEICLLLDPSGNALSRPVRTGKTSLLNISKAMFGKQIGIWERIEMEIQELIKDFEQRLKDNKTDEIPNIDSRLETLKRGRAIMNRNKDQPFLVFYLDFSHMDFKGKRITVDNYNLQEMNDILDSTFKRSFMYKFFNNLEKSNMEKDIINDFRMELEKIIEINTLHEKILRLDKFLTNVVKYCGQINIPDEEIKKIVPKMVVLVDEFHYIETKLVREIDERKNNNNKEKIMSSIMDRSITSKDSKNDKKKAKILANETDVILKAFSLEELNFLKEQLIIYLGKFISSLKDSNNIEFYLLVGTNSFLGYVETGNDNSLNIRTFDNRLGNCCGITKEEIKKYLDKHLESFANTFNKKKRNNIEEKAEMIYPKKFRCFLTNSQTEYIMKFINNEKIMDSNDVLDIMQIYYNNINYTFTGKFTTFNIFSVCRTLQFKRIDAYWITRTADVLVNLTESDLHDYFIHKYKADEVTAKMNMITDETLSEYRQDTALKDSYKTRLIKFYFLGVMSIQEYVEEKTVINYSKEMSPIKKKTGKTWFYLAPSCVEARHVLFRALYKKIEDKRIADIEGLEKALLSFLSFSLLQRLKDTFYETLSDEELINESYFSEDVYSSRFKRKFDSNLSEHSEVINVDYQKPGRPEDSDNDLKIDMFMEIRDFVLRDKIKGVAIFEFKKNDPSKNADIALACIFLRKYYAYRHHRDVENVTFVGINVRTNYGANNKPKIEKVLGMDIRLLRILNKDIYTKVRLAHRNQTTDYLKNKAIVEFINSGQFSEMYENETMTINTEANPDTGDVVSNEQREASDAG